MEIGHFVDQRHAEVERFLAEHGEALRRQGSVVATYRHRDGRRLGPYHKLSCRIGQRQVAVYLGSDEDFVRNVRERLGRLQEATKLKRSMARVRKALRREARVARQKVDAELETLGLYRQGHEVRGWSTSGMPNAPGP